jgi:hypothetical protein
MKKQRENNIVTRNNNGDWITLVVALILHIIEIHFRTLVLKERISTRFNGTGKRKGDDDR